MRYDSIRVVLDALNFPIRSDHLLSSPLSTSDYTNFSTRAPSSTFFPPFSSIPTRPHGNRASIVEQSPANGSIQNGDHSTLDTTIPPLVVTQTAIPELAETPLGGDQTTTEIINVDSPKILEVPSLPQQSTEGHARLQIEEHPPLARTSTEGHVPTPSEGPPIIEDISVSQFSTDTQRSPEQVDRPSPRIPQIKHKAACSSGVISDVKNQVWHLKNYVERAWKQCREAAEPVFGPIPDESSSRRVDVIASL